jgi:retron-type reverse transcriptase
MEGQEDFGARSTASGERAAENGTSMMERVLSRKNLNQAYLRVKRNKGAAGMDGMTVEEALPYLKEHGDE